MIRILVLSDVAAPEGSGGVERTLPELYGRLAASGRAQVHLLAFGSGALPREELRDRVHIHRASRLPLDRLTGAQLALSAAVWRRGFALARELQPHVVHAHTLFFHTSLVAATVARLTRAPLLLTVHVGSLAALPQPYRGASGLYERSVGRLLLAAAARVICVSEDVRTHVRSLGIAPQKLAVVPNGVDLERFAPAPRSGDGAPVVVSVGRLIMNKGLLDLIEAAALLRDADVAFELRLIGEGPQRAALEVAVQRHRLEERVRFLGRRDDVPELLGQSDVFVRPSLSEGMSLAVLEAMAAGLPVVASDVSGTRELIADGESGAIVPPGNPRRLASALRPLLEDHAGRRAMGQAARRRAERHGWDRVADATWAELERVAL